MFALLLHLETLFIFCVCTRPFTGIVWLLALLFICRQATSILSVFSKAFRGLLLNAFLFCPVFSWHIVHISCFVSVCFMDCCNRLDS